MQVILRLVVTLMVVHASAHNGYAQLKAEPARVDFGQQKQEMTLQAHVTLTNTGDKPVEILGTRADCACTVAALGKQTLPPGESIPLKLSLETRNVLGPLRRTVAVQTSSGDLVIPLALTVIAYENWRIDPPFVFIRGSLPGQESVAHAAVTYTGAGSAKITGVKGTAGWLKATTTEKTGTEFEITLTKSADAPVGDHNVKVTLKTTDTKEPEINLKVFVPNTSPLATNGGEHNKGAIAPDPIVPLRVVPATIILPTVDVGQTVRREFTLEGWCAKEGPRITVSRCQPKLLRREGNTLYYEITSTPTVPGPFTGALRVFEGHKLVLEAKVILRAEKP